MADINYQPSGGFGAEMRYVLHIIATLLIATIVHIAYVLFQPSQQFAASIDVTLKDQGENVFAILDPDIQSGLLPYVTDHDLIGLCKFNLSKGPVSLQISVPKGYWSFAVYTRKGKQVYALNDIQADTQSFSVSLLKSKYLISQISGDTTENFSDGGDLGWRVEIAEDQGIALLWMPHGDQWRRAESAAILAASRCALKK